MAPFFRVALISLLFVPFSSAAENNATNSGSLAPAVTSPMTFASSKWIWTATTTANAFVAFRKDFTPPLGKALIAAEILITAENSFNLYVNGDNVGSGHSRVSFSHRFCVDLLPSYNVFAVNASTASVGGLLATILLTYTDSTTDTLVSDGTWRANKGLPAGFEQLSFDDTAWPAATVLAAYGQGDFATVVERIPSDPPVVDLSRADWVWTDVIPASGNPASSRAFRRVFTPAPGQVPASATIIIAADNEYTLYVNGVTVGMGSTRKVAQRYTVNFANPVSEVVLAVLATNNAASPAGLISAMEINMKPAGRTSCTAGAFVLTDAQWKSPKGAIPVAFEQPGFDDSAWPVVVAEEVYGAGPTWGTLAISAVSPTITI
ncbi:hypothetical protein B0H14DRAFT_3162077 [Mycena olivaceomarginata]|nr:hypothetical protein B0H14DRAFT_3162077 [Mycena olivaceomarginata]